MSNQNPNDAESANLPTPQSQSPDGIAPGAPTPTSIAKKPYEKYDDQIDAALPSLAKTVGANGEGMQSLAQSARGTQLNSARWTLILVGILTIGANAYLLYSNRSNVEQLLRQQGINRMPAEVESALQLDTTVGGSFVLVGIVFIFLGIAVKSKPVLCTSLGLALYVGGNVIAAFINPLTIAQGIIFKIAIIAGLFSATKAAMAYEKEMQESKDSAAEVD